MRVIFMGTPDFAVPALKALIERHDVVAVYCRPPRPVGRGHRLRKQPVHELAEAHDILVHTPARLSKEDVRQTFREHDADVAVVCAYGLLLPKPILDAPRLGCINIHASLLPRWRGASPIQAAIRAGDAESGVCIMRMEQGLDTGPVYARAPVRLAPDETAGSLHDKLATLGADMIARTLDAPLPRPAPQPETGVTYAPKLSREEGRIDWTQDAIDIDRQVRANAPWPGSSTSINGDTVFIGGVEIADGAPHGHAPGTVLNERMDVACGRGIVRLASLQKPGRKLLPVKDFLNGARINVGARFE